MARPSKITKRCAAGRGAARDARGFTLIESLIASVVLALSVAGVAGMLAASHAQASALQTEQTAMSLARQLIEEVAARPLLTSDPTPGWPTVTNRANFDSINDYNGYNDTAPVTMLAGGSTEVATGYTRSVSLAYPNALFGGAVTSGDWVRISVTAREPSGRSVTLNKLVARATVVR